METMSVILKPTERELKFQKELREEALKEMHREYDHVNHQKFDIGRLAHRLGLFQNEVEALMSKDPWPIEIGIRVCDSLNLDVVLIVEKNWRM